MADNQNKRRSWMIVPAHDAAAVAATKAAAEIAVAAAVVVTVGNSPSHQIT